MRDSFLGKKIEEERRHLVVHDTLVGNRPLLCTVAGGCIILIVYKVFIGMIRCIDNLCLALVKSLFALHYSACLSISPREALNLLGFPKYRTYPMTSVYSCAATRSAFASTSSTIFSR